MLTSTILYRTNLGGPTVIYIHSQSLLPCVCKHPQTQCDEEQLLAYVPLGTDGVAEPVCVCMCVTQYVCVCCV